MPSSPLRSDKTGTRPPSSLVLALDNFSQFKTLNGKHIMHVGARSLKPEIVEKNKQKRHHVLATIYRLDATRVHTNCVLFWLLDRRRKRFDTNKTWSTATKDQNINERRKAADGTPALVTVAGKCDKPKGGIACHSNFTEPTTTNRPAPQRYFENDTNDDSWITYYDFVHALRHGQGGGWQHICPMRAEYTRTPRKAPAFLAHSSLVTNAPSKS